MTPDEFTQRQDEILKRVPRQFRGALSYKAYEDGHSAGHGNILIHLEDLVDALEKPIKIYTSQIAAVVLKGVEDGEKIMEMLS